MPTKARLVDCLTHSHLNEEVIEEIPHMKPTLFKADSHWLFANNQIAQVDPTSTNYYYKYNGTHELPPVLVRVQVQMQEQGQQVQQPPLPLPLPVRPPTAATDATTAATTAATILLLLRLLYY